MVELQVVRRAACPTAPWLPCPTRFARTRHRSFALSAASVFAPVTWQPTHLSPSRSAALSRVIARACLVSDHDAYCAAWHSLHDAAHLKSADGGTGKSSSTSPLIVLNRHGPALVLFARQWCATPEDVVQAAFLRAYERIGQFDETRPFGPWFLRSVVNGAIDAARQLDRMISLDQEDETGQPSGWLAADSPCPEDFVETAETRQAVRCALDQLTAEQRAAIVLRHFLDMSENEMTLHLQRPPSTIKWRLHEARKRLRALLRVFWLVESQDQQEE